jgi:hypothetical protein
MGERYLKKVKITASYWSDSPVTIAFLSKIISPALTLDG